MKATFKSLVAMAAFIAAGAACADTVSVAAGNAYKGAKFPASETFTLSRSALGLINATGTQVAANSPGVLTTTLATNGTYRSIVAQLPNASLTFEDPSYNLDAFAATGGVTLTTVSDDFTSTGGSLTIADLTVDLLSKRVYATITGANGVGTVKNVNLWNLSTVTGNAAITADPNSFTVSGLSFTADGYDKVATALGLTDAGKSALSTISDFGNVVVSVAAVLAPIDTCSVSYTTSGVSGKKFDTKVTFSNNTSNAVSGWTVDWKYSIPTLLTKVKNAKITNSKSTIISARPLAANTTIPAHGSTTFSFSGHGHTAQPVVSDLNATLGGQSCAMSVH